MTNSTIIFYILQFLLKYKNRTVIWRIYFIKKTIKMEFQNRFKLPRLIVNSIAKTGFKIKTFWKKESLEHQEKLLFNLIHKCRNTVYWKRYWFSEIKTLEDFQRNVPVVTYKEFQSWKNSTFFFFFWYNLRKMKILTRDKSADQWFSN